MKNSRFLVALLLLGTAAALRADDFSATPVSLSTANLTGVVPISKGGTASGTALSGSTIMTSNGSAIVQGTAGTSTTLLHGNASGAPTYGAVSLSADVTGTLSGSSVSGGTFGAVNGSALTTLTPANISNGALPVGVTVTTSNVSATGTPSASTYLRGDNSWATVAGGVTIGGAVSGGAANAVLYEDASQNAAASSAFTFNGSTITVPAIIPSSITFQAVLGTAANPSVQWGTTKITGFYNSASAGFSQISLAYNGIEKIKFPGNNTSIFEIGADGNVLPLKFDANGTATTPNITLNSNQTGMWGTGSGASVNWGISGTEYMRLTTTGLKIGSAANPAYALDVAGNVSWTGGIAGITDGTLGAASGFVGQIFTASSTTFANTPATTVWGNVTSVAFTAGDYDVSGCVTIKLNGATATEFEVAVSTFSSTTTTDHVEGYNWLEDAAVPTAAANHSICIPRYAVSTSGAGTFYLKVLATFSAGNPQAIGTLKARRVR